VIPPYVGDEPARPVCDRRSQNCMTASGHFGRFTTERDEQARPIRMVVSSKLL